MELFGHNIDFISYYVVQPFFINKARRFEEGTVYERMAVNPEDFVKVKIKIPTGKRTAQHILYQEQAYKKRHNLE